MWARPCLARKQIGCRNDPSGGSKVCAHNRRRRSRSVTVRSSTSHAHAHPTHERAHASGNMSGTGRERANVRGILGRESEYCLAENGTRYEYTGGIECESECRTQGLQLREVACKADKHEVCTGVHSVGSTECDSGHTFEGADYCNGRCREQRKRRPLRHWCRRCGRALRVCAGPSVRARGLGGSRNGRPLNALAGRGRWRQRHGRRCQWCRRWHCLVEGGRRPPVDRRWRHTVVNGTSVHRRLPRLCIPLLLVALALFCEAQATASNRVSLSRPVRNPGSWADPAMQQRGARWRGTARRRFTGVVHRYAHAVQLV